jgi:hypothetical protein
MKHYLIIGCDDSTMTKTLATSLLRNYWYLTNYVLADNEVIYYAITDLMEDISGVVMLTKKEKE